MFIGVATLNRTELYKDWEMRGHIQNNVFVLLCLFIYKEYLWGCSEVGLNHFWGSAAWAAALWAECGLQDSIVWGIDCPLWDKWKDCPCSTLAALEQLRGHVRWYLHLRDWCLWSIFLPELVCWLRSMLQRFSIMLPWKYSLLLIRN